MAQWQTGKCTMYFYSQHCCNYHDHFECEHFRIKLVSVAWFLAMGVQSVILRKLVLSSMTSRMTFSVAFYLHFNLLSDLYSHQLLNLLLDFCFNLICIWKLYLDLGCCGQVGDDDPTCTAILFPYWLEQQQTVDKEQQPTLAKKHCSVLVHYGGCMERTQLFCQPKILLSCFFYRCACFLWPPCCPELVIFWRRMLWNV